VVENTSQSFQNWELITKRLIASGFTEEQVEELMDMIHRTTIDRVALREALLEQSDNFDKQIKKLSTSLNDQILNTMLKSIILIGGACAVIFAGASFLIKLNS